MRGCAAAVSRNDRYRCDLEGRLSSPACYGRLHHQTGRSPLVRVLEITVATAFRNRPRQDEPHGTVIVYTCPIMDRKKSPLTVHCTCCEAILTVDPVSGEVLFTEKPKKQ